MFQMDWNHQLVFCWSCSIPWADDKAVVIRQEDVGEAQCEFAYHGASEELISQISIHLHFWDFISQMLQVWYRHLHLL